MCSLSLPLLSAVTSSQSFLHQTFSIATDTKLPIACIILPDIAACIKLYDIDVGIKLPNITAVIKLPDITACIKLSDIACLHITV